MQADMPPNEYYELFKPDYSLFIKKDPGMRNDNTPNKIEKVRQGCCAGLWRCVCVWCGRYRPIGEEM